MAGKLRKIVETKFTASGNMERHFSIMEKAASRFGRTADRSFKRLNRRSSRFGDIVKGIVVGNAISKATNLISQGLGEVVSQFVAFDHAAMGAAVRFKDIGPNAVDFKERLLDVKNVARDMGATTEYTAARSAKSLDTLARAGWKSAEAFKTIKSFIDLATASGEDFNSTTRWSTKLLGAFGLDTKDVEQKIKNTNRLNDVLVKAANSANVTLEDLFETTKIVAPIGTDLGLSLEQIVGYTAILANAGIDGSLAATALKNSFLRLSTMKKPVADMLQAINVKVDDGAGNLRSFTDIMRDLGAATKDMGNIKRTKVFETLFGLRGITGASNITRAIDDTANFIEMLNLAQGTVSATAEKMRTDLQNRLNILGSTAIETGFKIITGASSAEQMGDAIGHLTQSIRDLDTSKFVGFIRGVGVIAKQVGGFIWDVGDAIGYTAYKAAAAWGWMDSKTGGGMAKLWNVGAGSALYLRDMARLDFKGAANNLNRVTKEFGVDLSSREAPNAQEARAKAERLQFQGQLNIMGAPDGSTVEEDPQLSSFHVQLLGAQ